jgi:hypothetical protein
MAIFVMFHLSSDLNVVATPKFRKIKRICTFFMSETTENQTTENLTEILCEMSHKI